MDGREMLLQEFRRLVADVEIDEIQAALFHFGVNCACHHVAWREFCAFVIQRHEACACRSTGFDR